MTLQELAHFDGQEGRPAYVAVNGNIYDVSASPYWVAGDHQNAHRAGQDLTEELKSAPHVRAVIDRFPIVDQLTASEPLKGSHGKLVLLGALVVAVVVTLALLI